MRAAGFEEPRPIQAKTIPAVLSGRDVLGLAQTGTGKTAAFALPIISNLLATKRTGRGPRALILAPTRELAMQIERELSGLASFTPVRSIAVFGGVPIPRQIRELQRGPDVLVACPGRLLDLHQRRNVDLSGVEVLVLDEADHMFDMGFLPDIRRILSALPARRQNLLFSATMPREIRHLADRVLQKPLVVELEHTGPAETIEHALYPVDDTRKQDLLMQLLGGPEFTSAIVFLRTKFRARRLAEKLDKRGRRAIALQGNMSQSQRERAMQGFRDGKYDVLVATDIAARGIDVTGVSHVVNFDVPHTADAYTHRIGRTGRSERSGKACTFVTAQDRAQVQAIEKRLGKPIERIKVEGFGWREGGGSGGSSTESGLRRPPGGRGRPSGRSKPGASRSGSKPSSRPGSKGAKRRARRSEASAGSTSSRSVKPSGARTDRQRGRSAGSGQAFGAGVDSRPKRGGDRKSRPARDAVRS